MRVPDELANSANLELGVEFKCKATGDLSTVIALDKLPFTKPSIQSFFEGIDEESFKSKPQAVLAAFEKAFEHYPDEPQLQLSYAYVMVQIEDATLRDLKKAIVYAKKAAEGTGSMRGYAMLILAMAYHKDGQLQLAVEAIKQAAPLCGEHPEFVKARDAIMKDVEAQTKER